MFAQPDLDRVWNLCVALFLGATVYAFLSSDNLAVVSELMKDNSALSRLATINQSKRSLFLLLQWLPMMFLPMVLAQVFGDQARFDLSTFSGGCAESAENEELCLGGVLVERGVPLICLLPFRSQRRQPADALVFSRNSPA